MITEKDIEKRLKESIEARGQLCIKMQSNHINGMPDRLCTLPEGRVVWVELKAPGRKPRKLQRFVHEQLRSRGQRVEVVSTYEEVEELMAKYYAE